MGENLYENLMEKCLKAAEPYRFQAAPNPLVGAIIYDEANGKILSTGAHKKYGEPHAEVNAISALGEDFDFSDKTLIVNLEPCSHFGKTPPCADLIVKKGIKRVVIGTLDPNEKVKGRGVQILKNAGIEVITGVLEDKCKEFNKVFFKNITKKLPYVLIKSAITLDSKIATESGASKWITGEIARGEVQKLRGEFFGIMSATGTILADNPRLNCRIEGKKSPDRIILDRFSKIPFDFNVFKDDGTRVFLFTNNFNGNFPKNVIPLEFSGFLDMFKKLYEYGIYSIFVEGGKTLVTELIKANLADELYLFIAPKIFGKGLDFIGEMGVNSIDEAKKLKFLPPLQFGEDILIRGKF